MARIPELISGGLKAKEQAKHQSRPFLLFMQHESPRSDYIAFLAETCEMPNWSWSLLSLLTFEMNETLHNAKSVTDKASCRVLGSLLKDIY